MQRPPPPPNDVEVFDANGRMVPPWQRFFLDLRNFVIVAGTAPADAKYLVQGTANPDLTNAQFLGNLATGLLKVTTITGVVSIAVAADLPTITSLGTVTVGIWNAGAITSSGVLNGLELSLPSSGGAATIGQLTLVGGTKTVNTTAMTATARAFFQRVSTGGTIGFASTYTQVNGVSFTLNSDNPLDTSVYNWLIVDTH